MSFFRGSNWPAVLPQCGMIMMLSKYFLKANLSRIWTPYSFRGKFISTSNAIPGRRLLLDCFCATCQSIIEEDIQRGCYQHVGTLQLTINRVAGDNMAGEEVEKCERLQEKNSAFSIERCGMWCANEIFSSILYHRSVLSLKTTIKKIIPRVLLFSVAKENALGFNIWNRNFGPHVMNVIFQSLAESCPFKTTDCCAACLR